MDTCTFEGVNKDGKKVVVSILKEKYNTYRGKSICDPNDEYDFEFGKKLSKLKALAKKYNYQIKELDETMEYHKEYIADIIADDKELEKYKEANKAKFEKVNEEIQKLIESLK